MFVKQTLCVVAAMLLTACTGISTAKIVTNMPADVSVDGQFLGPAPPRRTAHAHLGPAPVAVPVPWRNIENVINYAQRKVKVTIDGKVVWEKEISSTIYQMAQTGDYQDGSQFGTGRTYTIMVDVRAATQPATTKP